MWSAGGGMGHPGVRPCRAPPPPPSRTKWTRLVHPSVLIGHVSSLFRFGPAARPRIDFSVRSAPSAERAAPAGRGAGRGAGQPKRLCDPGVSWKRGGGGGGGRRRGTAREARGGLRSRAERFARRARRRPGGVSRAGRRHGGPLSVEAEEAEAEARTRAAVRAIEGTRAAAVAWEAAEAEGAHCGAGGAGGARGASAGLCIAGGRGGRGAARAGGGARPGGGGGGGGARAAPSARASRRAAHA